MGGMEIERKFLVKDNESFKQMATGRYTIRQGYFAVKGATVRIRQRDEEAFLTIKGPVLSADGLSRYEYETPLKPTDAAQLFRLCIPPFIIKTRYIVPVGSHIFEVDEFHGDNEGLVVAEVELQSETESFEKPPFLGEEVTGQHRYYNSALRRFPYKEWEDKP